MELILQGLILAFAIFAYINANKLLKDAKDDFKEISGYEYDEYVKKEKLDAKRKKSLTN